MGRQNWHKIKTEYLTTDTSYRRLAQKYGVNLTTLARQAKEGGWVEEKEHLADKTLTQTISAVAKNEVNRATRLQRVADKLLDKIEDAVDGYTLDALFADRQSLRHITGALKDIKDIQMIKSEADLREQEARIDKLRKEAERDADGRDVRVVISAELEEYSK